MRWFFAVTIIGAALAGLTGLQSAEHHQWYNYVLSMVLAIGLYANTSTINLNEAKAHWWLIVKATTVGVMAKAAIIGAVMALILRDPFYIIVGMAVAQIDPVSVAALEENSKMSAQAKTILRGWSSFDDPVTVLLTIYVPYLLNHWFGAGTFAMLASNPQSVSSYGVNLGVNVLFAAGAFYVWRVLRSSPLAQYSAVGLLFIIMTLAIGARWFWMLGVALAGLDIRPRGIKPLMVHASRWCLVVSVFILGAVLAPRFTVATAATGALLGVVAFFAQVPVAWVLTRKLPRADRVYLMFAQQNGITAIILALLLEAVRPGVVAVVGPAIFVIFVLHELSNKLVDRRLTA